MSEANESYDQLMDRCRRAEARVKEETDHGAHYEELWRKEHIRAKKADADLAAHHKYVSAVSEGIAGVPCPVCAAGRESGRPKATAEGPHGNAPEREPAGTPAMSAAKPAARHPPGKHRCDDADGTWMPDHDPDDVGKGGED